MGSLKFFVLLLSLTLVACASQETSHTPYGMRVANMDGVKDCRFLGDVHGVSALYGLFAESGLSASRQQAFEQARALGADTVVWEPFTGQHGSTSAHGAAYTCITRKS